MKLFPKKTMLIFGLFALTLNGYSQVTEGAARNIATQVQKGQMNQSQAVEAAVNAGATPDQIQQGLQEAKKRGYFQDGMVAPTSDVQHTTVTNVDQVVVDQSQDSVNQGEDDDKLKRTSTDNDTGRMSSQYGNYFGYSIFSGPRDRYLSSSAGADNLNYVINAGDELNVSIWGATELRSRLVVERDGTVFVTGFGQMMVAGITLGQLKQKLTRELSNIYQGLSPSSGAPTIFLDVALAKLKSYTVFLVGYVNQPGAHQISSFSTLFAALYQAGGPTIQGSLRDVQLIREGKIIAKLDLYDFILSGTKKEDRLIQDNDVIFIPKRLSTITLKGEVNSQSIFELKENENLTHLIEFDGGLKTTVDLDRVQIARVKSFGDRNAQESTITLIDHKLTLSTAPTLKINPIKLSDFDVVNIFPLVTPMLNYVDVTGAVLRPGRYAIEKSMTINQLIIKAQNLLPEAYKAKADLTRTFPNGKTQHIAVDLNALIADTLLLTDYDVLKIYSIWDLQEVLGVKISGHVKRPGIYHHRDSLYLKDLLFKAGGLEDSFFRSQTYLIRADLYRYNDDKITKQIIPIKLDLLLAGDESQNLILHPRDEVVIYDLNVIVFEKTISISGEVKKSGRYELKTNMGVKDLILQAGGFTKQAFQYNLEVYRMRDAKDKRVELSRVYEIKLTQDLLTNFSNNLNFQFEDNDFVVVRKDPDFEYQHIVSLLGEVKYPGAYAILHRGETLRELIIRAGGLTEEAFLPGLTFSRNGQKVVGNFNKVLNRSSNHIVLKAGDEISIGKHPHVVSVGGEVNSPGLVQYNRNWKLRHYVEAAGDYTFDAAKRKTITYYPGGNAKRKGLLNQHVPEGSYIVVAKKPIKEKTDMVQLFGQIASITASLITTLFIVSKY